MGTFPLAARIALLRGRNSPSPELSLFAPSNPDPPIELVPKVILVLEDDLTQSRTIELFLRKNGYATLACHRGEDAVALAVSEKPDYLVADIAMEGMNGSEAVARIAANPDCSGIGIVFLSSLVPQTDDHALGTIKIDGRSYPSVSKASLGRRLIPALRSLNGES